MPARILNQGNGTPLERFFQGLTKLSPMIALSKGSSVTARSGPVFRGCDSLALFQLPAGQIGLRLEFIGNPSSNRLRGRRRGRRILAVVASGTSRGKRRVH